MVTQKLVRTYKVMSVFDMLNAFTYIERSHKSDVSIRETAFFVRECATCTELPSNKGTMTITKVCHFLSIYV